VATVPVMPIACASAVVRFGCCSESASVAVRFVSLLAAAKIRAAERAWTAYRDAYLAAAFPLADKQTVYGSIYPMEAAELRAQVTLRQVDAIDALIARYRSP